MTNIHEIPAGSTDSVLPKTKLFALEGNIGCGKSTFLKIIASQFPDIQILNQPLSEWQNVGSKGVNLLEMYYKEPKRWGLTFLNYAVFTRLKKWREAEVAYADCLKITERSLLADKHVFSELMKDLGYIDEAELTVFREMHAGYCKMFGDQSPAIIYLRCDPSVCHKRTISRKRPEQGEIPLEYLQRIHEKHEVWMTGELENNNVLVLDTSKDFAQNPEEIQNMTMRLCQFLADRTS